MTTTRSKQKLPATSVMRAWAIKVGWKNLGTRGRLPQIVIDDYIAHHPSSRKGAKALESNNVANFAAHRTAENQAIRAYGKKKKYDIGDFGRIPQWLRDEYRAVHGKKTRAIAA